MLKQRLKRTRTAWLLLLVYASMMIAVSLHHHSEAQSSVSYISCQECEHHVHHDGHLLALQTTAHDCLLCQLLHTHHLPPTAVCLFFIITLHRIIRRPVLSKRKQEANDAKSTRAPPCVIFFTE